MHHFLWKQSLCCTSRDHRRKWLHQSNCTTPLKWSVIAEKARFVVGDGASFLSAEIQWCVRTDFQWGQSTDQILHFSFRQVATAAVWNQAPQESFINSLFQELLQKITFSFRETDLCSSGTNVEKIIDCQLMTEACLMNMSKYSSKVLWRKLLLSLNSFSCRWSSTFKRVRNRHFGLGVIYQSRSCLILSFYLINWGNLSIVTDLFSLTF